MKMMTVHPTRIHSCCLERTDNDDDVMMMSISVARYAINLSAKCALRFLYFFPPKN